MYTAYTVYTQVLQLLTFQSLGNKWHYDIMDMSHTYSFPSVLADLTQRLRKVEIGVVSVFLCKQITKNNVWNISGY